MESNKKIIEYDIIEARYLKKTNYVTGVGTKVCPGLLPQVRSKISEGWIPQGGVSGCINSHNGAKTFTQAMIKYES